LRPAPLNLDLQETPDLRVSLGLRFFIFLRIGSVFRDRPCNSDFSSICLISGFFVAHLPPGERIFSPRWGKITLSFWVSQEDTMPEKEYCPHCGACHSDVGDFCEIREYRESNGEIFVVGFCGSCGYDFPTKFVTAKGGDDGRN
jgi:hypothetical protein